ncbi:glycerate kinase [Ligilactobacillus agilis]
MTRVLIAADSFKGSASSKEVATYLAAGIKKVERNVQITEVSIADGGEGTVESILDARGGKTYFSQVVGPFGKEVTAKWGMIADNQAVIEVAEAAGIAIAPTELNPLVATTYGVGQLINEAIAKGAKQIYVGLGGSASNDGGVGLAQALGGHFLDKEGKEIGLGGRELNKIWSVDLTDLDRKLDGIEIVGLSDVTNPLTGPEGASIIFGPQKGAGAKDVELLDQNLNHLANLVDEVRGHEYRTEPGAGAAGGTGYALMALLGGVLHSGIDEVMRIIQLEEKIATCDLVITGEGQIDGQSLMGKAPIGVAKLAKKQGLPVIAVAGGIGENIEAVYDAGIDLVISSTTKPMTVKEAMSQTAKLLTAAGYTAMKAYLLGKKS